MDVIAAIRDARRAMHDGPMRWVAGLVALVALTGGAVVLVTQVEVTDDGTAATRTCGSAFDTIVDRTGWESWWASDLDEPDSTVRSALVRTEHCPGAVNARIAVAAGLGGLALVLGTLARRPTGEDRAGARVHGEDRTPATRLARLGTVTTWIAGVLTAAGIVAVVVLVADADSTLFLYTDRIVVGVVGLIVLIPTIALFVIGRALNAVGDHVEQLEQTKREGSDV